MKLYTPSGKQIIGTKETVPGTALTQEYKTDGEPIYDGETKVWWDDQKTVWSRGSRVYICEDGEEWRFDELTNRPPQDRSDDISEDEFDRLVESKVMGGCSE